LQLYRKAGPPAPSTNHFFAKLNLRQILSKCLPTSLEINNLDHIGISFFFKNSLLLNQKNQQYQKILSNYLHFD